MTDARKRLSDVHNTGYPNMSGYYIIQTYTYSIKWLTNQLQPKEIVKMWKTWASLEV